MDDRFLKYRSRLEECRGVLSHLAAKEAVRAKEDREEESFPLRSVYYSDRIRINYSKAMRRMSEKTQVFPKSRVSCHLRDRMVHTIEVVGAGGIIADILGLNVDLAEAIGFGHDIGHVPFGHAGEHFLAKGSGLPFTHEKMGVVVARHIERNGEGMNMTEPVLEGMLRHSGVNVREGMSQEAWDCYHADKIAYLTADPNDLARMGIEIGHSARLLLDEFGSDHREREATLIAELCLE